MDRPSLLKQWPQNGSDVDRAKALVALGYPAVAPILGDIVLWLKGRNEVAIVFREFLAQLGEPAVPLVREALRAAHETQAENLLCHVLPSWPKAAVVGLAMELEQMLQQPSVFGLNVWALSLIAKNGIATHAPVSEWAAQFRQRAESQIEQLDLLKGKGA